VKTPEKTDRAAWATLTHDSLNTTQTHKPKLTKIEFVFLNFGLLLGNILVLFNTGAFASVTLHAAGELGVSPSHAGWMQTYYFIALALSLPISGWLSMKVGEIRLYLGGLLIMVLASLLCALTDDLFWFLFGRAFQGFFGGLTIPLSQTLLMRQYPLEKKSFAVALWSMAALSPFTIAPAVGGWIGDEFGWRWLFYLNVPLPLLAAGLTWALLSEEIHIPRKIPFDSIGFWLLAAALVCLQTVLNQGQDSDWYNAPYLVWLTILGVLLLAYFVIWELAARAPLLNLRLFSRRNFAIGSVMLSVAFMMVYGLLSVLLVRLQAVAGYTSFLAGSVLLPLIFLAKPMASVIHKLATKFDARLLVSINMLLFALYCWWSSGYDFFQRGSFFAQPLWSQVLEGFCLGGLFVPLTTLFLSGLNSKRQTQAVELGGMLRVLGGSVASPLFGVFWERRAAQHQIRLVDNFAPVDALSREVVGHLRAAGFHDSLAIAKVNALANQHAAILGLNDTFRLAAWLFLGLAVLVWFAHPTKPKKLPIKEEQRRVELENLIEEP
jgi:DHA2 family multidrug resistance protein